MNREYLSISDINKIIKQTIESNPVLTKVYIKGEISNFKLHTRGHLYFSLKDSDSKINAVMFSTSASNLNFLPKDGDSVLVSGRISVYEATGNYQIYVDSMQLDGIGNLYVLFEELKRKLSKEGLFDDKYKKHIPKIPKNIGVITASTGAAIKDIISTINKRFPLVTIYVFPTLVQGNLAKDNIVKMIELANKFDLDTLIVGRGGGSIEDLWPFNEEVVARAIFKSHIPVISAVGHEIDFTISDFVADLRVPTPTGAAAYAVPDKEEIKRYLISARERLNNALSNKLFSYNQLLNKYKTNYLLNNPIRLYEMKEQKLDMLYDRLKTSMNIIIDKNIHKLDTLKLKLNLLNPTSILEKGYSIIYKDDKIIKNINEVNKDDEINIMVNNGIINSIVKEVKIND